MKEKTVSCVICKGSAHWLLSKRGYGLYRCGSCRHIFVHPVPPQKELERAYSFRSGYQVQKAFVFPEGHRFRRKLVRAINEIKRFVPDGRLLDVGCSNGEFCVLARRSGFSPVGVELNRDTAAIAKMNGIEVRIGTLEKAKFAKAGFDAAYLGDVIEHVPDPGGFMEELARIVRKDGVIFIKTPNHEAFFPRATYWLSRHLGIPWSHPTPPHHLNQFSPKSLEILLKKYGFSAKESHYTKCRLLYELGATGVPSDFRKAARERKISKTIRYGLTGAVVLLTYTPVWLMDKFVRGRPDFNMNVVAVRT
jgi:2-polyprenyl-3-methyl-5-hydroxy-6-metoxy-1,4-benzoquinol methylase